MPIPTTPPGKKKLSMGGLPTSPLKQSGDGGGELPIAPMRGGGLPIAPSPAPVDHSVSYGVDDEDVQKELLDEVFSQDWDDSDGDVEQPSVTPRKGFSRPVEDEGSAFVEVEAEKPQMRVSGLPIQHTLSRGDREAALELLELIKSDDSSEVIVNGADSCFIKRRGQRFHMPSVTFSSADAYHQAINEYLLPNVDVAERVDGSAVLIEGQLEMAGAPGEPPMLARVFLLAPPLVRQAKITIAKKARYSLSLDDIRKNGAMNQNMADFLKAATQGRLTMIVAGPTGAGKTTLLQALATNFDVNDRVIVIEDTPELRLSQTDVVYLTSTTMRPGLKPEDIITTEFLVKAANRMRMDRIMVGECRGGEIAEWLIAANSGAEGSFTTVHADTPRRALDKVLSLATKSANSANEDTLRREIASTVDIIVQAGLIDGRHVITHIEEISQTIRKESGVFSTQSLFEYDRMSGNHVAKSRPSDDLINTLHQRGVAVNMGWFR